jgi:hypothetical protein
VTGESPVLRRTEVGESVKLTDLLTGDTILDPNDQPLIVWRRGVQLRLMRPDGAWLSCEVSDFEVRRIYRSDMTMAFRVLVAAGLGPEVIE